MTIFFTAATHFGHEKIIEYCMRPFASAAEMDEALIDAWNRTVGSRDTVFHLGDFAWRAETATAVFPRLNGRKYLISGNHDHRHTHALKWADVLYAHRMKADGRSIFMCHYAVQGCRDNIILHGHEHGNGPKRQKTFDVGVDVRDFKPVSWDQVKGWSDQEASNG